jgi:hypothetical protein
MRFKEELKRQGLPDEEFGWNTKLAVKSYILVTRTCPFG